MNRVFARKIIVFTLALAILSIVSGRNTTHALIEKLYSVKDVLDASSTVLECKVETVDVKDKKIIALVSRAIKGKTELQKININVGVGRYWHVDAMLAQIKPGDVMLLFYAPDAGKYAGLAYCKNFFLQIFCDIDKGWWNFFHIELMMSRTYIGTVDDLIKSVEATVAGKGTLPEPDPKRLALTREDLLGKREGDVAKALTNLDDPDGYEITKNNDDKWTVQHWGTPSKASLKEMAGRGKVINIVVGEKKPEKKEDEQSLSFKAHGKDRMQQDKVAVFRRFDVDFSEADRMVFEVRTDCDKPVQVAWAFHVKEVEYTESQLMTVVPGRWNYDMALDLRASDFKTSASKWEHKVPVSDLKHLAKLQFLIYGAPTGATITVDRIRLDRKALFVRSIPLAHDGGDYHAVSWTDFNGDGKLDAMVCSPTEAKTDDGPLLKKLTSALTPAGNKLFRNDAAEFSEQSGAATLVARSSGACWADYDGDGDLDLLLSTPALWTNDGGKFRDDSALLPKSTVPDCKSAIWMDANGDGRPDMLLSGGTEGMFLFLNNGKPAAPDAKWFTDASAGWALGKGGIGSAHGDNITAADADGDGFTDFLYDVNKGMLATNQDGKSFKQATAAKIEYNAGKLGTSFGDYDNDGDLDLFVPQSGKSCLFRNNNDGTFTNIIAQSGELAGLETDAQSSAWGDINLDGNLDLVIGVAGDPALIYLGDGKGGFTSQGPGALGSFACATGVTGMAFADFDDDGDLDLLVGGSKNAGILVNACVRTPGKAPLRVILPRGTTPGAIVRLNDAADKSLGIRQLGLAGSFASQAPQEAHFAVTPGKYKLSILHTNGQVAQEQIEVPAKGLTLKLPKEAAEAKP